MKGAIWSYCYARGNWGAYDHVGCAGVEFLFIVVLNTGLDGGEGMGGGSTLQKSIDLTPLLPNAGPTGGLGLACPAPTISFTI